jgi:phosphohistidine phosphatase
MTLEVIVVRHAIAFERNRRRWPDDELRPLRPAGKRRFRKAALGLRKWSPRVDAVLSSPFVRTRQTAELLTKFAGWPAAIECSALVPGTPPARLVARLRKMRDQRVAVVGHEPHLSTFISACLTKRLKIDLKLRKGGVAHLTFGKSVAAGSGTLAAFLPPRVLRAIR